jgi:hypothetical protein
LTPDALRIHCHK